MQTRFCSTKTPRDKPSKWVLLEIEPESDLDAFLSDFLAHPEPDVLASGQHNGGILSDALLAFAIAGNVTPWLHLKICDVHGRGVLVGEELP